MTYITTYPYPPKTNRTIVKNWNNIPKSFLNGASEVGPNKSKPGLFIADPVINVACQIEEPAFWYLGKATEDSTHIPLVLGITWKNWTLYKIVENATQNTIWITKLLRKIENKTLPFVDICVPPLSA